MFKPLLWASLLMICLPLQAAERVALVIGNASYQKMATLTGPKNDAEDIAKRLTALGFRVLPPALNLNEEAMLERIEGFAAQARGAEVALLYYAGHGMQLDGVNYLLPVDIDPGSSARVKSDGTKLDFVLETMKSSGARSSVVVLDACRNTSIPAVFRDGTRGFVPVDSPQGFLIAYATAAGAVAQDLSRNGRNSPYAKAFLEELAQSADAELEVFLRRVGNRVFESTNKQQFPATYNSLTEAVVLGGRAVVTRPDPVVSSVEGELRIEVSPATASVRVDGVLLGTGSRTVRQPAGKTVVVSAQAEGYVAIEERVLVQGGQVADVVLRLPALAAPQPQPAVTAPAAATGSQTSRAPGTAFRDKLKSGGEGPEMVVIPAGRFLMGSPESEAGRGMNEGPQREVSIGGFAMGTTEVTFADYDRCAAKRRCKNAEDEGSGRGTRPVINVNWADAQEYAAWLSEETGQRYRLPSEAEWEYAARAGTTGPFSFEGTISPAKANYDSNHSYGGSGKDSKGYREKAVPAGSLPANPWGLHEVHGNVSEWVQDCYEDSYAGAPMDGSAVEGTNCEFRVMRGGSGDYIPDWLRSASRDWYEAASGHYRVGFRLVRTF